MSNFYNDNDPFACAWLRELIKANLIAPGVVDERSICDIQAEELKQFTQCHFFAGIGGWSLALRLAGWPDDEPVWTGSCPCQPLSCAGQRKGHADERHLWPAFHALIAQCRPATVFGEQVASADGREWLAGVRADLEAVGYAVGSADLCAAGVGAPHRRQRIYWVADNTQNGRGQGRADKGRRSRRSEQASGRIRPVHGRTIGHDYETDVCPHCGQHYDEHDDSMCGAIEPEPVGNSECRGRGERSDETTTELEASNAGQSVASSSSTGELDNTVSNRAKRSRRAQHEPDAGSQTGGVGQPNGTGPQSRRQTAEAARHGSAAEPAGGNGRLGNATINGRLEGTEEAQGRQSESLQPGRTAWANYELLPCLDGKARRIEPGTFPLAHGVPARVGRLRGYGNAIVPQVAAQFIGAFAEAVKPQMNADRT